MATLEIKIHLGIVYRRLDEYLNSSQLFLEVIEESDSEVKEEKILKLYAYLNLMENHFENNNYNALEILAAEVKQLIDSLELNAEKLSLEIMYQTYDVLLALEKNHFKQARNSLNDIEMLKYERRSLLDGNDEQTSTYTEEPILITRAYAQYKKALNQTEEALQLYDQLSNFSDRNGDIYNFKFALNQKIEIYRAEDKQELLVQAYEELYEKEQYYKEALQIEYQELLTNYVPASKSELISSSIMILALGLFIALVSSIVIFQRKFKGVKQELNEDPLCHVYNRRYMQKYFKRITTAQLPMSVMMIDIDYFKKYNDYYGHLAGDDALCQVANLLKSSFRHTDVVVRYGGEEFCVILPHTTKEESKICAKKLIANINGLQIEHQSSPIKPYMTLSIGIQTVYKPSALLTAIHLADKALYKSKQEGRNQFTHYFDYENL